MKENILIAIGIILLASMWLQFAYSNSNNRYEIITNNNMLTILLDKKTGMTWRNTICNEKTPILGCWDAMYTLNQQEYLKPIGERKVQDKLKQDMEKLQQSKQTETDKK